MKHSEIRQHIVETASSLFYKNGYNLTGINEIISEADIAKATLYNHFSSKEAICISYLQYKNSTFLCNISNFCNKKKKGKNRVLGLFDFLSKFFKDNDFNGCWCIRTVAEIPQENEHIRVEIQNQKSDFIDLITELVTINLDIKTKKEAISLARSIYLLYESAVSESHLHQKDWPIKMAKQLCSQIIV